MEVFLPLFLPVRTQAGSQLAGAPRPPQPALCLQAPAFSPGSLAALQPSIQSPQRAPAALSYCTMLVVPKAGTNAIYWCKNPAPLQLPPLSPPDSANSHGDPGGTPTLQNFTHSTWQSPAQPCSFRLHGSFQIFAVWGWGGGGCGPHAVRGARRLSRGAGCHRVNSCPGISPQDKASSGQPPAQHVSDVQKPASRSSFTRSPGKSSGAGFPQLPGCRHLRSRTACRRGLPRSGVVGGRQVKAWGQTHDSFFS